MAQHVSFWGAFVTVQGLVSNYVFSLLYRRPLISDPPLVEPIATSQVVDFGAPFTPCSELRSVPARHGERLSSTASPCRAPSPRKARLRRRRGSAAEVCQIDGRASRSRILD